MQKSKNAFTMIELIFVIVILGILGAVAIGNIMATRDDAKISKTVSNISLVINDFGSYFISNGEFGTIGDMSNVNFIEASSTDLSGGGSVTYELTSGSGVCFTFTTTSDGNLTIIHTGTDTGVVCSTVASLKADLIKTYSFSGAELAH